LRKTSKTGLAVVVWALASCSAYAQQPGYKVIVREDHPGTAMQKDQLASIFLGEARSWGTGGPIRVVDQSTESPVREAFSRGALGQSVEAVKTYWKRQILSGGLRPPPVKDGDLEVIEYVGGTRGSIGYVSADAQLPPSVKEISILE